MDNLPSKIKWSAPEYEFHEKIPEWYWVLGIITAAMVLAAVVLRNFLFAVFAVLAGFSVGLYGARRPRLVSHEINPGGVLTRNKNLNYEDISHFWVNYDPPTKKELILESKKTFSAHTVILLGNADPEQIRRYLLQYLKEKKIEESLVAVIARALKF
ncbi:MAG: hypothetical protein A2W59_00795 [Candidatus Terrybacteria bacterium RIFCSPHIGHO2_02_41_19]|uniref:DUF5673 domain-containing protein n=1 Tax=Candidatus Terrybacteria bacterium RIFCSPHIGHO2_02_41_19 TaxID=1802364 RepID=A0A1G2PT85_9BACT|nr:MAG: hypothetical protein A2W59_00795 [Candidatus Terrybacteria bacterium RIFCSPHIGHO2_02_41_19]